MAVVRTSEGETVTVTCPFVGRPEGPSVTVIIPVAVVGDAGLKVGIPTPVDSEKPGLTPGFEEGGEAG